MPLWITKEQIAESCGVHKNTVAKWLRGRPAIRDGVNWYNVAGVLPSIKKKKIPALIAAASDDGDLWCGEGPGNMALAQIFTAWALESESMAGRVREVQGAVPLAIINTKGGDALVGFLPEITTKLMLHADIIKYVLGLSPKPNLQALISAFAIVNAKVEL